MSALRANDVALREVTTIGVGGVPAELIVAKTYDEVVESVRAVWATGEDWFVLGGGSNVVVRDVCCEGAGVRKLGLVGLTVSSGGRKHGFLAVGTQFVIRRCTVWKGWGSVVAVARRQRGEGRRRQRGRKR